MIRKYSVLIGVAVALLLLLQATLVYPGGSLVDKNTVGFDWSKNFISNLFAEKAINGLDSPSRIWAISGMFFFSVSFAIFFIGFSTRIPVKLASQIVKYCGVICMLFAFLIVTPLHDIMITTASTMFLIGIFYITVFVFKSRLHVFKFLCVVCLLVFYSTLYIYGSGEYRESLPLMQKVTFALCIILVLGLEYFTNKEDFQHISPGKSNTSKEATNG